MVVYTPMKNKSLKSLILKMGELVSKLPKNEDAVTETDVEQQKAMIEVMKKMIEGVTGEEVKIDEQKLAAISSKEGIKDSREKTREMLENISQDTQVLGSLIGKFIEGDMEGRETETFEKTLSKVTGLVTGNQGDQQFMLDGAKLGMKLAKGIMDVMKDEEPIDLADIMQDVERGINPEKVDTLVEKIKKIMEKSGEKIDDALMILPKKDDLDKKDEHCE